MGAMKTISRALLLITAAPWAIASAAVSPVTGMPISQVDGAQAAPDGITAISGRVLATDGTPLRDVVLRDGIVEVLSDKDGRFLLKGVAAEDSMLIIDGRASRDNHGVTDYGYYEARVHAEAHKTTALSFTSYLPKIDHRYEVTIASPTTKPVVVTTPAIPGLELRIPAGAILTDPDGKSVTKVGITPIPIGRTPFPLPKNVYVPIYFTAQPGGAVITNAEGIWKGAQVVYPNYKHEPARARGTFWRYDPDNLGWTAYGIGTVTADRKQIVPDDRTQIYTLAGAMFNGSSDGAPPASGPNPCAVFPVFCAIGNMLGIGGDPVDLSSGLFVATQTDLALNDVTPLAMTRTYRPGDYNKRSFGIGMTLNYEMYLWSANQYQEVDLVTPDGGRVHYTRIPNNPPSNGWTDATFVTSSSTIFNQSHITWNGNGWNLVLKDGTLYVFGENAPLQYIQDRFGNRTTMTRAGGPNGHVTQVTSPDGRFISFTYDSTDTYITQATDSAGRIVKYGYDTSGRLTTVTNADGGITTYTWDSSNRVASIQDANKHTVITNTYDTNDRVKTQTMPDGSTYQFSYTLNGSAVAETDTTDTRQNLRKTTFDTAGFVVTEKFAVGTAVEQDWSYVRQSGTELLLSKTDPLGRTTAMTYDGVGNLLTVTSLYGTANAVTTTLTYAQPYNKLASTTDALGHTTTIQNNALGQASSITDALGNQTNYTYDSAGRLATVLDPLGLQMIYSYDHGDLSTVKDRAGSISKVFVDSLGRVVQTTNPLGQAVVKAFDPVYGVNQITNANGAVTNFAFDPVGNLSKVTDARNEITAFSYDASNRLVTRTDPLLAADTVSSYDAGGNILSGKDRKGQVTSNTYDQLSRLISTTYADGASVTYTWDLGNRLTKIVDSVGGTITRAYDGLDRLTSETTSLGTVSYTYDAAGRLATKTIPGQSAYTYTFDNANRLYKIVQGSVTTSFTFDNGNRLSAINLPNSIVETYARDKSGNITSINVTHLGTTIGTLIYTYDTANRLSTRSGTLFQSILPTSVSSATYDAANRLKQWVTPSGTTVPVWDADGNLTSDGVRNFVWDGRNRLTSITGVASFGYDAAGRRGTIAQSGVAKSFLYDGNNAVQESSGGTVSATIMGGGGTDGRFTRTVVGGASSDYITDALGSTVALASNTGTIQTSYGYDPYGNTTASGSSSTNTYQYTNRENDGTGLYYLRARYYNPVWGRFISEDPIGLRGGINRYAYANGNPVQLTDPMGLSSGPNLLPLLALGLAGAAAGPELAAAAAVAEAADLIAGAAEGAAIAGEAAAAAEEAAAIAEAAEEAGDAAGGGLTRVGRWMSQGEFDAMSDTGLVQEGAGGRTYVVNPANPAAYQSAAPGSVYSEFNVPTDSLFPAGKSEWSVIPGPNVTTRLYGPAPTSMPPATCIVCVIGGGSP